jgi:hypothetical protein
MPLPGFDLAFLNRRSRGAALRERAAAKRRSRLACIRPPQKCPLVRAKGETTRSLPATPALRQPVRMLARDAAEKCRANRENRKRRRQRGGTERSRIEPSPQSVVVPSVPSGPVAGLPPRTFRDRGVLVGPEVRPASRTELRLVPDHADRNALDVGNFVAAKTKRVAAARLLLFGSIGMARG